MIQIGVFYASVTNVGSVHAKALYRGNRIIALIICTSSIFRARGR